MPAVTYEEQGREQLCSYNIYCLNLQIYANYIIIIRLIDTQPTTSAHWLSESFIRGKHLILQHAVLLMSVGVLAFISAFAPYNMDEFIHYNAILSSFPGNNIWGDSNPYKLNFLNTGIILPLRAFHYAGSFPALYYYPIYFLWSSPMSARALGLVFLCTGAFFASRTFRLKFKYVALGLLLWFPYVFQHVVDTGPVGLQILSVYLMYVLMDRWCATLQKRYIGTMVVLAFLCIWTKFSYFWMAPGFAIFFLIHACRHRTFLWSRKNLLRLLGQSLEAIAVLTVLVGALLLSTSPTDAAFKPYLHELMISESYTVRELLGGAWLRSGVVWALLQPLETTHRIFLVVIHGLPERLYARMLYLFVPVTLTLLFAAGLWRRKVSLRSLMLPFALYAAFFITVVMIARTKNAGVMHHAVLSLPFLVLAILSTVRCALDSQLPRRLVQRTLAVTCSVFLGINLFFFSAFPQQPIRASEHPSKLLAHSIVNTGTVPERFTILMVNWGTYFYEGLYGSRSKSAILLEGLRDPVVVKQVRDKAHKHGRKLIVMYMSDGTNAYPQQIQSDFPLVSCNGIPKDAIWQILYEPDEEMRSVCDIHNNAQKSSGVKKMLLYASLLN